MSKASVSTATWKSEHKSWEATLLDPAPGPLGSYKPFGLFLYPLSASYSVLLQALMLPSFS